MNRETAFPRRAFVGLGSNLEPGRYLRLALDQIADEFSALSRSPVCASPAEGYDGPDYWNLCVAFDTTLSAVELVAWLKRLEERLGRQSGEPRLAPKTLDADLLLLGALVSENPPLPHPEIFTRPYVLGPLAILAPDLDLPGDAGRAGALWRGLKHGAQLEVLATDPF